MKQVLCEQVGFSCDYGIDGETEEDVMRKAVEHLWEHHVMKQEEMTSDMKAKIKEKIQTVKLKVVVASRGANLHGIVLVRLSRELIRLGQSEP
jgi:predicted small metal-binding protein